MKNSTQIQMHLQSSRGVSPADLRRPIAVGPICGAAVAVVNAAAACGGSGSRREA